MIVQQRKGWMPLIVLGLCGLAVAGDVPPGDAAPGKNVILIGWDGAQWDHLQESLQREELPVLAGLAREGKLVRIGIEGATDTKAGWSQILTGYYPETTGVYHNSRFRPIPEGLSIFERLEAHLGPDRAVTLAVIGKGSHVGGDGPRELRLPRRRPGQQLPRRLRKLMGSGKVVEREGVRYLAIPGEPYYLTRKRMDLFENGLGHNDAVGARALELLTEHAQQPFLLFVHLADVDHAGHKHGENSKEYNDALISSDLWTGKILARVQELGLADRTIVYITADHGFDEGEKGHRNAPHVFLATNDLQVCRDGLRQDVAPTVLEALGLDVASLQPALDGISLRQPCQRGKVQLGPRPGLYPNRDPVDVRIEAEAVAFRVPEEPGFALTQRMESASGGGVLAALDHPRGLACGYELTLPRQGTYSLWVRYRTSRPQELWLWLDPLEEGPQITHAVAASAPGREWRWARVFQGQLGKGHHDLALAAAPVKIDCFLLTTRQGRPDLATRSASPPAVGPGRR